MAAVQPGVSMGFTIGSVSVQLSNGLTNRHGFLIQNNDSANSIVVAFGSLNVATVSPPNGFVVLPGNNLTIDSAIIGGTGPQPGASVPTTDIAAIAVSGAPQIVFMEW